MKKIKSILFAAFSLAVPLCSSAQSTIDPITVVYGGQSHPALVFRCIANSSGATSIFHSYTTQGDNYSYSFPNMTITNFDISCLYSGFNPSGSIIGSMVIPRTTIFAQAPYIPVTYSGPDAVTYKITYYPPNTVQMQVYSLPL